MNAPAYVAYCASVAGRMHDEHVQEEERRLGAAERRANPRGHGRRASDALAQAGVAPFVVAPSLRFRVLSGPHAGELVGADDVCECDVCEGSGGVECEGLRPDRFYDRPCPQCGGVGYVLDYPGETGNLPPVRLAVEETPREER